MTKCFIYCYSLSAKRKLFTYDMKFVEALCLAKALAGSSVPLGPTMIKFLPIFCGLSPLITQGLLPTLLSFTFCLETKSNQILSEAISFMPIKNNKVINKSRKERCFSAQGSSGPAVFRGLSILKGTQEASRSFQPLTRLSATINC